MPAEPKLQLRLTIELGPGGSFVLVDTWLSMFIYDKKNNYKTTR